MKYKILILLILTNNLFSMTLDDMYYGIRMEESSDGKNLTGDNGASLGPYHIQKRFWTDACEYGKVDWNYKENVYNKSKCEQVMAWYYERYYGKNWKNNLESCIRIHNGGPRGHKIKCTIDYLNRVKGHISRRHK